MTITTSVDRAAADRSVPPRGIRNCNPGNIDRKPGVKWLGMMEDQSGDPRFVVFQNASWGIRAIARVLITYQTARMARDGTPIDTIREIIERWAPPVENKTSAYVTHVSKLTGIAPDARIDVSDYDTMRALVIAIITHENGCQPYSDAEIESGLSIANVVPGSKRGPL